MGISFSGGIKIPEGSGGIEARIVPRPEGFRYWRLETQGTGSNSGGNSLSEINMKSGEESISLQSFTITNLGGNFDSPFVITRINNGFLEVSNGTDTGHVPSSNGDMDFYVDFGEGNEKDITEYQIAPQGSTGISSFHNILAFNAYSSSNAVDWTLVKAFTGITPNLGPWSPGTFRDFDLTT